MMPVPRTPLRFLITLVSLSAALGSTHADWVPSQVFTAAEYAEDNSQFGRAVAADGEWLFIGQPLSSDGGKVHVYRNTGGTWNRTQVISNPAGANGSQFGRRLDVSGTTAVFGAPSSLANANARAYIYEESGGTWSLEATLSSVQPARSQSFASHVATSGDFVLVGDNFANYNNVSQQGSVDVFRRDGMGGWFNKLLGGVSPDQVNAGGGVNEKAWIFGNDFDIFGEQVLATARVRNPDLAADSDQQGLYPSFNDTSVEGGVFLPYPGGSPAPIAPGVPLVAGATYSRPDRVALQNDGKGVAVVSFLDGSPSPVFVSASFVPVTRAPGGWSFGSPIPLPGSATSLEAAGSLALVLQNEELLVFEETSAWNLLDRFDAPTDVTDALAIVGEEFFIGAATASDIGIEQGAVHLYLPRVNTKPVVSLKGGKKLAITGPKAKLSGSVRDDVPGSRLEATFRDGSRTVKKRVRVAASGKWSTALSVPPGSTKVTLTATDSDGARSKPVKVKILRRP